MLNRFFLFTILLNVLFSITCFAMENSLSSKSELVSRYHVVQGPIAATDTYRIDTHKGDVWILTSDAEKKHSWSKLVIIGTKPVYSKPSYQIHLSGIMRSTNMMIDTVTGNTFEFFRDSETDSLFLSELK